MKIKLKTKRLILSCMDEKEIAGLIEECEDEDLKNTYIKLLDGAKSNRKKWKWYAPWSIVRKEDGVTIGGLGFRGAPRNNTVSLGYGIKPEYEGKGYMTEAVGTIIEWALGSDEDIYFIEAETAPDDCKSQQVLIDNGFVPDGESVGCQRYVKEANVTNYVGVYMCFGICFGVCFGLNFDNLPVGIGLGIALGTAIGVALNAQYKRRRETARNNRENNKKDD